MSLVVEIQPSLMFILLLIMDVCSDHSFIHSLFRRFTIEVFVVLLRFGAGMMDNSVPMIRRRIERIELHWNTSGIDDVVIRPGRDEHREARADYRANVIENRLTSPFLHAKELSDLVHFHPDIFGGL